MMRYTYPGISGILPHLLVKVVLETFDDFESVLKKGNRRPGFLLRGSFCFSGRFAMNTHYRVFFCNNEPTIDRGAQQTSTIGEW